MTGDFKLTRIKFHWLSNTCLTFANDFTETSYETGQKKRQKDTLNQLGAYQ